MYCVKCGVQLQEGAERCPLCHTPVWNPDNSIKENRYPDKLPRRHNETNLPGAIALTVICIIAIVAVLTACYRLYGTLQWGGYVVYGILLFYIIAVLPLWFHNPLGEVFVPVDHAAAALYVLYICLKTGGHWFMSFAFPVILASCIMSTAAICLLKYVRGGRLFIFGGLLIALGGFTVLVEFFEHLSFGTEMFRWSLYSLGAFGVVGLFLLIAGIIPSLRHSLEKRFFF